MTRPWRLLTARGRLFLIVGVAVVLIAMASGQRDVMRLGLLLAALPVVAMILVSRARLRMSCERSIEHRGGRARRRQFAKQGTPRHVPLVVRPDCRRAAKARGDRIVDLDTGTDIAQHADRSAG